MKTKAISLFTTIAIMLTVFMIFPSYHPIVFATQTRKQNFSTNYTLTGNASEDIIRIAQAQIGKNGKDLGYSEEWCANFVSDCADLAGQSKAVPRTGAVSHEYTKAEPWWGLKQTIIQAGGINVGLDNAQPGDIVFFSGHVEIVYSGTGSDIESIGGNTGNGSNCYSRVVCSPRKHGNPVAVLRPNYTGNTIPVPTYSILTANKSMIAINEEITFTANSDYATGFTIGVDNAEGRYATKEMVGNSITMKFDKAGSYGAYVTSYNSKGYCDSAWINFMVYNEKPSISYLSANKSAVAVGEEITFTATSDEKVKGFTIGVCKGENRVVTQDLTDGKISLSFNEPGNYGAYVTAWNDLGYYDSSWIDFIVYDSKPNTSVLFVDRNIVEVGEPVIFSATSDAASGFCVGVDNETERVLTQDMEKSQLKITFDKPGNYSAYVTAFNNMGYCDSARVYFIVVDSKPTVSEIFSSTNKALVDEEIKFYASSDIATAFWAGIDYNGERYKTEELINGQLTCSFDKPGRYTAYVTSSNKFGYVDSKLIVFNIYSDENEMIYNGDCNMDGDFTIADIIMLQKWLLKTDSELSDWKAADLCTDNEINVFDLCMMKHLLIEQ